jgi:hypothetical protein
MSYYDYINELNQILVRNGFVRKIRYRIVNQIYTLEMFETIDNPIDRVRADQLYQLIYTSRCQTSDKDKRRMDDLLWTNDALSKLGFKPCQTKTAALRAFKKHVHISIYDLLSDRYDKAYSSRREMFNDFQLYPALKYPLSLAKQDPSLRMFLKTA